MATEDTNVVSVLLLYTAWWLTDVGVVSSGVIQPLTRFAVVVLMCVCVCVCVVPANQMPP